MRYLVKRYHLGEKPYQEGDIREANETVVAHLVAKGVLEKMAPAPANKAAFIEEHKGAPLAAGPTGQDDASSSSPAGPQPRKRASRKRKAAAPSSS